MTATQRKSPSRQRQSRSVAVNLSKASIGSKADQRTKATRAELLKLTQTDSTQETEKIFELLHNLADTEAGRKSALQKLLPKRQLAKTLKRLEEELNQACSRITGYRGYLKRTQERVDRFANMMGGKDTWGFVHGVDHEDVIDLRNAGSDIRSMRNDIVAKEKVLLALHRTATKGNPYGNSNRDEFDRRISSRAHQAWEG